MSDVPPKERARKRRKTREDPRLNERLQSSGRKDTFHEKKSLPDGRCAGKAGSSMWLLDDDGRQLPPCETSPNNVGDKFTAIRAVGENEYVAMTRRKTLVYIEVKGDCIDVKKSVSVRSPKPKKPFIRSRLLRWGVLTLPETMVQLGRLLFWILVPAMVVPEFGFALSAICFLLVVGGKLAKRVPRFGWEWHASVGKKSGLRAAPKRKSLSSLVREVGEALRDSRWLSVGFLH